MDKLHLSVLLLFATVSVASATPARPNILLVLADDMGWGDISAYNPDSRVSLPALERLAAEGMHFRQAYATAAACAPSRYTIMTGNFQWRGRRPWGSWGYAGFSQVLPGQLTLGQLLGEAGYATGYVGKWHLDGRFYLLGSNRWAAYRDSPTSIDFGRGFFEGPTQLGFDYAFSALRGQARGPYAYFENDRLRGSAQDLILWQPGEYGASRVINEDIGLPGWDSTALGSEFLDAAIDFIDAHHRANVDNGTQVPFFLYFASHAPHSPWTPPTSLMGTPVAGASGVSAHLDTMVELDASLGHMLDALEARGLLEDTLVVFTSDNGGIQQSLRLGHDSVGGLRGQKGSTFEGGTRVPLILKWGDGTAAGSRIPPDSVSERIVSIHDLFATIASIIGVSVPLRHAVDSHDFSPALFGSTQQVEPTRWHLLTAGSKDERLRIIPRRFAFRRHDDKVHYDEHGATAGYYDLSEDPAEIDDRVGDDSGDEVAALNRLSSALMSAPRTAPLVEGAAASVQGRPTLVERVDSGIFVFRETYDGPYQVRILGTSEVATVRLEALASVPFTAVTPRQLEGNDRLDVDVNHLTLRARLGPLTDGIDIDVPAGERLLLRATDAGGELDHPIRIGRAGTQVIPTGWLLATETLPYNYDFQPLVTSGAFLSRQRSNADPSRERIALRLSGVRRERPAATVSAYLASSTAFLQAPTPRSVESCCDQLTGREHAISLDGLTQWRFDGFDVQRRVGGKLGVELRFDGRVHPFYFNWTTGGAGQPNAYWLPAPSTRGEPPTPAAGSGAQLHAYRSDDGGWSFRALHGNAPATLVGSVRLDHAAADVTGVHLEQGDLLDASDPLVVRFSLLAGEAAKGFDINSPGAVEVELDANSAADAARLRVGADGWRVQRLPVTLSPH